jgi:hypothetical protein
MSTLDVIVRIKFLRFFRLLLFFAMCGRAAAVKTEITLSSLGTKPAELPAPDSSANELTWWLPAGAQSLVLPIAAGVVIDTSNADLMRWLREGSPWDLMELPLIGARYGDEMAGLIVPYPHYAELVIADRIGIRFSFPKDRRNAAPAEVVAFRCGNQPLELARVFREWRQNAASTGAIPRRKTLQQKAAENPRVTWLSGAPHIYLWGLGDGISIPMLEALHDAGIERALLLLSDLYAGSPPADVAECATKLGYLLGPYDSYHSVHDSNAVADDTWETAQFDKEAFTNGRVLKADGTGHGGFKGRGFHFSPLAARPYMEKRVTRLREEAPYSAWFVDCDATGECFDDYNPLHPATRLTDTAARHQRLAWLGQTQKILVGSEGGSVLFSDIIHFGHGVQTPYIGHLDPAFRDAKSAYFLGRHFPADTPQNFFKQVPVPAAIAARYFNPTIRIPLYRAALGDEVIATHHWSFDSLKFSDVAGTRELLDILYMVPPLYHLNRATWPARKERILRHLAFWAPLHRQLATAPLTRFEWLSPDRTLQRTTFSLDGRDVTITVNFSDKEQNGFPGKSASVSGEIKVPQSRYISDSRLKGLSE